MPMVEFMRAFAERRHLKKEGALTFRDDGRPRIYCEEPVVVARFVSEVRQEVGRQWPGAQLFLRGQAKNHRGMVPGLFRERGKTSERTLRRAEAQLEGLVRRAIPGNKRFARADLAALLQHYGVNTSWLDVVDDLRVAVWFATHDLIEGQARRRAEGSGACGWIFLLSTRSDGGCLTFLDLRAAHHGLSLRPHAQQGWSLRGPGCDLNEYVVATVQFPICQRWHLDGHLATAEYLLPPATMDDTLARLLRPKVAAALRQAESDNGLPPDSLGFISVWR